jgi:hypothetical protein
VLISYTRRTVKNSDGILILTRHVNLAPIFLTAEIADMNHQHDEEHADGHQVNGELPTEEELDAYEEKLTNEAIVDQVKVALPPDSMY